MSLADKFKIKVPTQIDENRPIMVVDNQLDMRLIVVHQLHKLNFSHVVQASDGMEALESLRSLAPMTAIFCSMDLPQMSGLELLTEIREDERIVRPPFCVTMSDVSKDKLMFAVETGVDEILVKPYTLGDIIPKLRRAFTSFHNPKNPEKIYELAKECLRLAELDKGQEIYQQLGASAPSAARPMVGLAKTFIKRNDLNKALEYLETAEKNNPHYVHLYSIRGDIYALKQEYDEATKWYKKAIDLSPLNPARYASAAEILLKQEKYENLIEILDIALKNKVSFNELYHYLSQAHYYQKDYQKSAKYIRKAVDKDPDNTTYLNQLALSLKESGDLEEARKYYNKVIKMDPDNKQALFNKAIMLAQSEKHEDAIKILERLILKYPDFERAQKKLEELKNT